MNVSGRLATVSVAALELLAAGCATKTLYHNPNLQDATAVNRQFAIDDGYCVGASMGSVPMPQIRVYSPAQTTYNITGTVTTPTGSQYRYAGQAYAGGQNFASGFATGMANGAAIGAAMAARDAQRRVYHGCMLSLGWEATVPEGRQSGSTQAGFYAYPCAIKQGPGCTN